MKHFISLYGVLFVQKALDNYENYKNYMTKVLYSLFEKLLFLHECIVKNYIRQKYVT